MKDRYPDNPFAEDSSLWQTYGLFGMNSNYFTMLWSKQSDPRVLCDPVVDVLVYRRAALRALRKLNGTIRCKNADGETYDFRTTPTWAKRQPVRPWPSPRRSWKAMPTKSAAL